MFYGNSASVRTMTAPKLSPKTKVPIWFENDWHEVTMEDWSDVSVWGRAEVSVAAWTGAGFDLIPVRCPVPVTTVVDYVKIKLPGDVLTVSHDTLLLGAPLDSGEPIVIHPLLTGVTLREASKLSFGSKLVFPVDSACLFLRDMDDVMRSKKSFTAQVEKIKLNRIAEDEYAFFYTVKVPTYGNFVTSSGIIVST